MFHVEHSEDFSVSLQLMRSFRLFSVSLVLSCALLGCKKADEKPELKDPLHQNLTTEAAAIKTAVDEAKLAVTEAEAEVKKAVPHTGQHKFAQKRYWEARNRLTMAQQKYQAVNVIAEMRMWKTRVQSLEAFHKGEEWAGGNDLDHYQQQETLNRKSRNWSVKERRAALGLPTGREVQSIDPDKAAAKSPDPEHK